VVLVDEHHSIFSKYNLVVCTDLGVAAEIYSLSKLSLSINPLQSEKLLAL